MTVPQLGVGLVCLPGLETIAEELRNSCNVLEVEPQPFWGRFSDNDDAGAHFQLNEFAFERLNNIGLPILVHSVGCPVGGSDRGDPRQVAALRETFASLKPAWWSEHMSFLATTIDGDRRHAGFLMPPIQTRENIRSIVGRIKALQDSFGIPFAFETGVNYLRPLPGEIPDAAFWGEIAIQSGCGILLDLHNVWANEQNGRQQTNDVISQLPLELVWEIHLAGGKEHNTYWLDSHSGLPPAEVTNIARNLVPLLPNLGAMIFEFIPDYVLRGDISPSEISDYLAAMQKIWDSRRTEGQPEYFPPAETIQLSSTDRTLPDAADWEETLVRALDIRETDGRAFFADDPGLEIYRDLIAMVRRGTIAETLPLTTRYLLLSLGAAGTSHLLKEFWDSKPPQPFMSDEAMAFAEFITGHLNLAYINELTTFEIAAHRAAMSGKPQYVHFNCHPLDLIQPLKNGCIPDGLAAAKVEVEVLPPKIS